ncbi:hypothetical protein P154DRAFT_320597 [Amniculicola lignicola CBS 123094]|uniref:F-box domain-containing protein n=1 Tax=Amniculicola lignicola CBS 123094 TaxID=1392246 RepID=A0A6A5WFS5_9PLEO|nr:hypothetical protein P154DRAFT_320597 [Amniculicola lignicola CBS 123094]
MTESIAQPPNLLTIPTELRFHIYEYLSLPHTTVSQCIGLFSSCKKIHAEAHELIKNTRKYLKHLEQKYNELLDEPVHITRPQKLLDCDSIEVLLSYNLFVGLDGPLSSSTSQLSLYLDQFAIIPLRSLKFQILGRPGGLSERLDAVSIHKTFSFIASLDNSLNDFEEEAEGARTPPISYQIHQIVLQWSDNPHAGEKREAPRSKNPGYLLVLEFFGNSDYLPYRATWTRAS